MSESLPPELPPQGLPELPPELPVVVDEEDLKNKRSKRTFWQKLGGEGLMISVIIHAILIIIALVWVISTWTDPAKKDPDSFSTGQGGGAAGERAKEYKTRLQPKNPKTTAKSVSRITTKSPTASLALPDMPATSMASLNTGLMGGGQSKGFGGGSGGGIGSGMGAGRGNGKNFVSLFGSKGGGNGLVGSFYDIKQTASRKPTPATPGSGEGIAAYREVVKEFFAGGWTVSKFSGYYKSPDALIAGQIFVPSRPADAGPAAFGVEKEVKPSRWIAHYKATVEVPQSLPFRFVGSGDDWLLVRWDRKVALDDGYEHFLVGDGNYKDFKQVVKSDFHIDRSPGSLNRLACGPWINTSKGTRVPIEIIFGETPGGVSDVYLAIEVAKSSARVKGEFEGEGTLKLFRVNSEPLPDEIKKPGRGLNIDMEAEGWIFKTVPNSVSR